MTILKLNDNEKNLLFPLVRSKIDTLQQVIAYWEALPDDATVNALERFAYARATEELPQYKALLNRIVNGDPKPSIQPVLELSEEDVSTTKEILYAVNEAKFYTDQASDKLLLLSDSFDTEIDNRIVEIISDLSDIEATILTTFPQMQED